MKDINPIAFELYPLEREYTPSAVVFKPSANEFVPDANELLFDTTIALVPVDADQYAGSVNTGINADNGALYEEPAMFCVVSPVLTICINVSTVIAGAVVKSVNNAILYYILILLYIF
jgi:hypothetical protein